MSATKVTTDAVIAFLGQPSSYPHHPPVVKIIQTHASVLAVAPPFVYKVKKHIDLGFMKFTTLQERKINCERELALNSRFCADLYKGVLPVAVKNKKLVFGSDGEIVEYVLQMNLLPDGYFMDQLLQADKISEKDLDAVMQVLQDFYNKHRTDASVAAHGNLAEIRKTVWDNQTLLEGHAGDVVAPAAVKTIGFYFNAFMERHQALFQKRVRELRIQDCHGDLHLDHIHIRQGRICIFDCIEFNDRFRYIDVASDIAFLAMDLDFHGRPDLARYLAHQMAELLHDPDVKLLLDFYKCTRACVRANVECIRALEPEVPAAEQLISRERAGRYTSLALRYALFGSKATVLLVFGRIGSGKSTIAKSLAQLLGCRHLNSDVIRKEKAQMPLFRRTDPERRVHLYTEEVTAEVYQSLLQEALATAEKQQHIVLDATFGNSHRRAAFVEELEQQNISYFFLEVSASEESTKKRLEQREHGAQEVSDARLEDFERLYHLYQDPDELQPARLLKVNSEPALNVVLQQILLALTERELEQEAGAMPST